MDMRFTRVFTGVAALLVALVAGVGAGPALAAPGHAGHAASARSAKPSTEAFDRAMRKLWEDHVTWTRLFIVSASADLPDLEATTDRLLRNQTDIGDAIAPYYGVDAGAQLTALLRDHILGAADLLAAAKAGDDATVQQATGAWYANGDDIAGFLSDANPKQWAAADMQAMMRTHLDLTLEEAVAHLEGRYADDVAAYDKVHDEILEMADMLAAGIVAQFPNRFTA
jgi:hypothetical protein